MKNQKGFTLIELLLVLAIIGIISAIAIPAMLGQRENARQKATEGAAAAIKGELVAYADGLRKKGTSPTAAAVLSGVNALDAYKFPAAKNAYTPTASPYTSATAAKDGEVGLVAGSALGADGASYEVIVVSYKHAGAASTVAVSPVSIDN